MNLPFVMLITVFWYHSPAMTVMEFQSAKLCEAARPVVEKSIKDSRNVQGDGMIANWGSVATVCIRRTDGTTL